MVGLGPVCLAAAASEMENYCKTEGMKKHMPEGDQIMALFFLPDCFRSLKLSELKLHMAHRTFSDLSSHFSSMEQVSYVHSVAFKRRWTAELRPRADCF